MKRQTQTFLIIFLSILVLLLACGSGLLLHHSFDLKEDLTASNEELQQTQTQLSKSEQSASGESSSDLFDSADSNSSSNTANSATNTAENANSSDTTENTGTAANTASTSSADSDPKSKWGDGRNALGDPVTEVTTAITSLDGIEAGTLISENALDLSHLDAYFTSSEISNEIYHRIAGLSYKNDCTVPLSDLRYIKLLHYGFDQKIHVGELIVNARLATDFLEIFTELFNNHYEIEKMYLIDLYDADDTTSIDYNNTSAFNFRLGTGSATLSTHANGCAIDINPQYNPYIVYQEDGSKTWSHENANAYVDRENILPHMINHEDLCYQLFTQHGFTWVGDWYPIADYQHFEIILDQ